MSAWPRIPGYELIQCLGGGQLAQVFSARDCASDTACAVKVLREEWGDQPTAVKLLQREARAGLKVRHPHLVRVLDAHVTRPPYYLVMELVAGESLWARLQRDYRLDLATALWVARQTAEALAAVHRAGFIHGDVKPDNVRLVDDGTVVLIDLGFAHRPGENAAFLRDGYVMGTVDYLAPELCAFRPDAGQAADWFSFGVALFEMLTGRLPYAPGSVEERMRRRCTESPTDLRDHPGPWPVPLVNLVERLLRREPAERPRAAAVVQQLVALEIAALRRRRAA
jgi:serine/threonine protein kinase